MPVSDRGGLIKNLSYANFIENEYCGNKFISHLGENLTY